MACAPCQKNKKQYEVINSQGTRVFGPTPYKTTADAMAQRHNGTVREVPKDAG
ncbi:hypothetical protein ABZ568_00500 [Streptomyces olindensis]|uniref:Uncharacterized protein n=1 Tax=Streptomyces olindensis TaxID=358823 RepID=A0ABV2XLV5_9ACTN